MGNFAYKVLCLLVLFIPLENAIVLPGFGTISRVIGIFGFIMLLAAIVVEKRGRSFVPLHFLFLAYVLWSFSTFFWSVDPEDSLINIKSLSQLAIFVWMIWEFSRSENERNGLLTAFVAGTALAALSVINSYMQGNESSYLRFSANGFNSNDIGLMLALGVPISWHLSFKKKNIMTWIYRLYVPIAIFSIFLTASRSSFSALLISLLYVFYTLPKFKNREKFFIIFITLAFFAIFLKNIPTESLSRVFSIIDEVRYGDFSNRLNIWISGLEVFYKNPIIGTGIGTFKSNIENAIGSAVSSHNLFLTILVGQGLVGFLLFISILGIILYKILLLDSDNRVFCMIMVLVWFFGSMTLDWGLRKPTWFLLAYLTSQIYSKKLIHPESEEYSDSSVIHQDKIYEY